MFTAILGKNLFRLRFSPPKSHLNETFCSEMLERSSIICSDFMCRDKTVALIFLNIFFVYSSSTANCFGISWWKSKLVAIAMWLLEGLWIICQEEENFSFHFLLWFAFICEWTPRKLELKPGNAVHRELKFTACSRLFWARENRRKKAEGGGKKFPFSDCLKIISKHSFILILCASFFQREYLENIIIYENPFYFIQNPNW